PAPPATDGAKEDLVAADHLTRGARVLAQRGDCQNVALIGRRIRQISQNYYDNVFRNDPEIAPCLSALPAPVPVQPQAVPPHEHAGVGGLRVGAYMMGIGLITGVVSVPFVSAGPGVIGLTIAVLLVAIGLLVLLLSALIYATNDG